VKARFRPNQPLYLIGLKERMTITPLKRSLTGVKRKLRSIGRVVAEVRMFARAMRSPRHPILAHIIPTRRCNLACAYCNEYDHVSQPVPTDEMLRRVDRLAGMGTTIITISGGEPMLHPELDSIIRRIRHHGVIATVITNGYLLTPARIRLLNRTGLHQLQISIDNVSPDDISKKSLKVLDQKLRWLAEHAEFAVNINAVVGSGIRNPEDALTIARRAASLGFAITTGVIHDGSGQVRALSEQERRILDAINILRKPVFSFVRYNRFQHNLARGEPTDWRCRAGSRYLYICENGLVHWCSQQRGYPAIPLEHYSTADLEREFHSVKSCAPYCTINCVQQTAMLDELRENPRQTILTMLSPPGTQLHPDQLPRSVRLLSWLFLSSPNRGWFGKAALRLLGVK
jgi:MoaA/NifB/PqqE/SkfB family radical SAM enzyme